MASLKPVIHKLLGDGTLVCKGGHWTARGTPLDRDVTCGTCLKMMALAAKAAGQQKIPPERWP